MSELDRKPGGGGARKGDAKCCAADWIMDLPTGPPKTLWPKAADFNVNNK